MTRLSANLKLLAGIVVLTSVTAYLAYLGATSNWQYYVLVDECVDSCGQLAGKRVRVNGRVALDSLRVRDDRRLATFTLAGDREMLPVACRGPLPDNLKEDIEVVVEGTLEPSGTLRGDKVLTKCASKYQAEGKAAAELARKGGSTTRKN